MGGRLWTLLGAVALSLVLVLVLLVVDVARPPKANWVNSLGEAKVSDPKIEKDKVYALEILQHEGKNLIAFKYVPRVKAGNGTIGLSANEVRFEGRHTYTVKVFNPLAGNEPPVAQVAVNAAFVTPIDAFWLYTLFILGPPLLVVLAFGSVMVGGVLADVWTRRRSVPRIAKARPGPVDGTVQVAAAPPPAVAPAVRTATGTGWGPSAPAAPASRRPDVPAPRPIAATVPPPAPEPPAAVALRAVVVGAQSRKRIGGVLVELSRDGQAIDRRYSDEAGAVLFGEFDSLAGLRVRTLLQRQGFQDADATVPAKGNGNVELPISYEFAPTAAQTQALKAFQDQAGQLVRQCQPYSADLASILRKSTEAYTECVTELRDAKLFLNTPHDPGRLLEALVDDGNDLLHGIHEVLSDKSVVNLLGTTKGSLSTPFSPAATSRALRQVLLSPPEGYAAQLAAVSNQLNVIDHTITVLAARNDVKFQSRLWQEFTRGLSRPATGGEALAARWFGGRLRAGILEHVTREKPWV